MKEHQRLQQKTTDRATTSSDRAFKASPFQTGNFAVQQKSAATPASKAELWENYQQATKLTQNRSNTPVAAPEQTRSAIQTKLTIGQPGDKYEQEADSVADRVMAMSEPTQVQREELPEEEELQMKPLANTILPLVQREAMPEEELQMKPEDNVVQRESLPEEELQMKSLDNSIQREELPEEEELQMKQSAPSTQTATPDLESQLSSSKGGGNPLSDDVRSFMEPRFGTDFSGVRVHTGSDAVQMNQGVNAQAFAHGSDIYFGAGKAPGKDALTAHELTHVVQQTGGVQTKPLIIRRQDAGSPVNSPSGTDAGLVGGVPANTPSNLDGLPEDLQNFLTHGLFGPQALVPPTNIGGFDASYNPQTEQLLIQVRTGANFNDGLSMDGDGVITANHTDLAQAAVDGMAIPDLASKQSFINDFVWNEEQKQTFLIDLKSRVEGAWSSSATGLSFACTKSGWENVKAMASVDINVHEGATGAGDHLQTDVYKVPDSGSYSVGAFVQSQGDDDPHNNQLVMSSTDVNPTPENQSLLRKSVQFEHNSAVLSADAQDTLSGFAADFQDANLDLTNPVQLVGHASSSGSDTYNLQLAQQRIDAVKNFLSAQGFTGINDRVSTDNQGEANATEAPESRRVDLTVGSGEGQAVAAHEFGHVFGLDDQYVSDDVNPGGTIGGSGKAVGTAVGHDQMARDIGTSGAIAENNDGIMSLGNTIRGEHYATFGWSLGQVTGVTEWQII